MAAQRLLPSSAACRRRRESRVPAARARARHTLQPGRPASHPLAATVARANARAGVWGIRRGLGRRPRAHRKGGGGKGGNPLARGRRAHGDRDASFPHRPDASTRRGGGGAGDGAPSHRPRAIRGWAHHTRWCRQHRTSGDCGSRGGRGRGCTRRRMCRRCRGWRCGRWGAWRQRGQRKGTVGEGVARRRRAGERARGGRCERG